MRLLVTGCGGFVGSHLLDRVLIEKGAEVIGWDASCGRILHLLDNPRLTMRQRMLKGDEAFAQFEEDARWADWIVHLAAICNPSLYNTEPIRTIQSNLLEGLPVVEIASRLGKPLIFTSTSEVYGRTLASYMPATAAGDPGLYMLNSSTTPMIMGPVQNQRWSYAAAKQLMERLIYGYHKEMGLQFAIIRPFNFFGPRMDYLPGIEGNGKPRVLAMFLGAVLTRQSMKLVDGGHARRTITSIHDAIDAFVAILAHPERSLNRFYNIANPRNEVTMRKLAEEVRLSFARITGDDSFLSHPIEAVASKDFYGEGYEDCDRRIVDISDESALLDWVPRYSLEDLLDDTVSYYWHLYGGDRRRLVAS